MLDGHAKQTAIYTSRKFNEYFFYELNIYFDTYLYFKAKITEK